MAKTQGRSFGHLRKNPVKYESSRPLAKVRTDMANDFLAGTKRRSHAFCRLHSLPTIGGMKPNQIHSQRSVPTPGVGLVASATSLAQPKKSAAASHLVCCFAVLALTLASAQAD